MSPSPPIKVNPISKLDPNWFHGLENESNDICVIEVTVSTGFEIEAAEECEEKLNVKPHIFRGKLFFDLCMSDIMKVLALRSIDHASVVNGIYPNFEIGKDRNETFAKLYKLAELPLWKKTFRAWESVQDKRYQDSFDVSIHQQEIYELDGFCTPKPDLDLKNLKDSSRLLKFLPQNVIDMCDKSQLKIQETDGDCAVEENEDSPKPSVEQVQRILCGPKFRVSCHKAGVEYNFGSAEAARQFGGGINTKFGWPVDLSNYELDVQLNICSGVVYTSIAITKDVLFKRNLLKFGKTNLRATICYNMLRMVSPQPGEFILDHMCGGGAIPLEGALTYKNCMYFGGDIFTPSVNRAKVNIDSQGDDKSGLKIDLFNLDARSLPLKDQCVDVVVSDLPFGKRMGSKTDNRTLYYDSLIDLARVVRIGTGRAALLTHDKSSMTKSLARLGKLWKNSFTRTINIGGLAACVYMLKRTGDLNDGSIIPVGAKKKKYKLQC